jgi:hypothetical protein
MIVEKPAVGISVYKNLFKAQDFIEELEKECENSWSELEWVSSGTGPGSISSYRTSMSCSLASLFPPYEKTALSELFSLSIKAQIEKVVKDYIMENLIPNGVSEIWSVLKYSKGAEYKGHYDRGPNAPRTFSMVAMLGSPIKGGELEFPNFNVTIPAEEGSVILFPSNFPYLHIAHPVEEGTKYSLVTWYV